MALDNPTPRQVRLRRVVWATSVARMNGYGQILTFRLFENGEKRWVSEWYVPLDAMDKYASNGSLLLYLLNFFDG